MKRSLSIPLLISTIVVTLFSVTEFFIENNLLLRIEAEYGPFAKNRTIALVEMMNKAEHMGVNDKLKAVNVFFNQIRYGSDKAVWGASDYWATRLEFVGKGKGDCEDYVIAKYFTLLELGVDSEKLFFTYVKYKPRNIAHMVLSYYETPNSAPLILDNYNRKIFPASKRNDLIPIYSFSGEDLLGAKEVRLGKMLPASTRQTRPWDELTITKKELP